MDQNLLARYGAPVPRYTSYPTAPHFHPAVNAASYRQWLGRIGAEDSLSLYLHVPFCSRLCWYCGCHTKLVRQYQPIADYAELLAAEIGLVAAAIPARPRVPHVHWGGGTPTMLAPDDFERLMAELRERFHLAKEAEVAIEIDPRGLTAAKVAALAASGVTRASLGVQDFTPAVQQAINRIQPFEVTADAVERLRAAGIAGINLDIMYGLPHQSVADAVRTADLAADLAPDRLAVFGYAHVPWMKTHQRMIDEAALPDAAARLVQSEAMAARLIERGYRRIGLDHFARPADAMARALAAGRLRRNFQGYSTDEAGQLIGFGASSIGALAEGYVQNAVPVGAYGKTIRDGALAVTRGIALSPDDRLRRAVIERLMCDLAVDLAAVTSELAQPQADFSAELAALAPLAADGLIVLDGPRIAVTESGRPFVRAVCARFDRYLASGRARHSRAV